MMDSLWLCRDRSQANLTNLTMSKDIYCARANKGIAGFFTVGNGKVKASATSITYKLSMITYTVSQNTAPRRSWVKTGLIASVKGSHPPRLESQIGPSTASKQSQPKSLETGHIEKALHAWKGLQLVREDEAMSAMVGAFSKVSRCRNGTKDSVETQPCGGCVLRGFRFAHRW